jgi:hypothetical protein
VALRRSSATPTVGPDGDVYFGVLENPFPNHNDRGWLLHFNSDLSQTKIPGSFGWDDTASIVPASLVSSYHGSSSYLLMTKYNNYGGVGTGDGHNRIAILDPNATENDPIIPTTQVMKEVITILGVTPDPNYPREASKSGASTQRPSIRSPSRFSPIAKTANSTAGTSRRTRCRK